MKKRQFLTKALLGSLPVAAEDAFKAPKLAGYCAPSRGAARPENGSEHDYKVV